MTLPRTDSATPRRRASVEPRIMSRPHRTQRPTARSDAAGSDASNPAVDSGAEVDERLPDLDEQSAALSADLVRVYLNEIGKVALLNAEQ